MSEDAAKTGGVAEGVGPKIGEFYELVVMLLAARKEEAEEKSAGLERRGYDRGYWLGQSEALRDAIRLLECYPWVTEGAVSLSVSTGSRVADA